MQDRVRTRGRHQRIGVGTRPRRRPATSPAQRAPQRGTPCRTGVQPGRQGADRGLKTPQHQEHSTPNPPDEAERPAHSTSSGSRVSSAPGPAVTLGQVMATNRAAADAHRSSHGSLRLLPGSSSASSPFAAGSWSFSPGARGCASQPGPSPGRPSQALSQNPEARPGPSLPDPAYPDSVPGGSVSICPDLT